MPANKNAIIRHRIIDQCINSKRHKFPSLEYLADRCSEMLGTEISTSTIEKDLALMKKDIPIGYNAPIVYSKQEKGYAYSEVGFSIAELNLQDQEWNALRFAAQLLYQYKDVPVFTDFKQAIERINTRFSLGLDTDDPIISKHVAFESPNATSGMEWIDQIFNSIRNRFAISFTYTNIYKKKTSTYHLIPYLLKEHRNRWYVIGWSNEKQNYTTFALDRILSLEVIHVKQTADIKQRNAFNADSFFKHATGIMERNEKPTHVELVIKEPISRLVLLEPIHASQHLIKESAEEIRISMTVYVNEEFCLRLLGMGPWCKVVKPASLKKSISDLVESMK